MINQDSPWWQRRDAKLSKLPLQQVVTVKEAAQILGIRREYFRSSYLHNCRYTLPPWIECIREEGGNNRLIALKRVQ